ncbi:helicase-related protein [Salinicoccus roseus]|uniref:helicase-related protein n=1 Tax=Salinicoccus roseus TaxID=45670 RepID=UPI00230046E3|nr:helicase-related protein [Salinicoccus roseus]
MIKGEPTYILNTKISILVGFSETELLNIDNKLLNFPEGLDMFLEESNGRRPKDYLSYFQNVNEPHWITYEEFFIFKNLIEVFFDDSEISVVYNNRFISLYPYNNSFRDIETFYEYLYEKEDYKASEIDKRINEIYTSIHNVKGNYYVSIDTDLLEPYKKDFYYQNEKELERSEELNESQYDYSFEYNDNPKTLIELNNYLERNDHKRIAVSRPLNEEIKHTLKILASIHSDSIFIVYQPIIEKKLIHREKEYKDLLYKYWKYDSFKNLDMYKNSRTRELTKISQAQIIDDIVTQMENSIEGRAPRDIFVTSSTGAGKSIMFQIPSLYIKDRYPEEKRLTLIISPLIGLMNDQVENLNKREIKNAKTINSGLSPTEKSVISQDIKDGKIDILYISIETLINRSDIHDLIGDRKIGLFVVDEAHTVTTWGRTFRVDYWYMGSYLNRLRKNHNFPIVTFTATAILGGPDDMYGEIKKSLNLVSPIQYIGKVTKDNIYMNIRKVNEEDKKEGGNDAAGVKDKATLARAKQTLHANKKMLIYFPTVVSLRRFIKTAENWEPQLIESFTSYHGQLHPEDKEINFNDFRSGKRKIMLATKAFGMGIDIPDIEVVYHYAITGSLLDYIQEIGRVAREPGLQGQAMLDYLPNKDFNEYKQLRGMSSMKKHQLIDVMDKILTLYSNSGNKRHLNISIESFDYIFNKDDDEQTDEELEKKVKRALLTIENDFKNKLSYPPFVSRPGSTNSEDFILVNDSLQNKINDNRYRNYFIKICDLENSYYNSIYIFRTEEYWKKKVDFIMNLATFDTKNAM